jgi:hypothetical protein
MERREFLKTVSGLAVLGMSGQIDINSTRKKIQLGCFNRPWTSFRLKIH